MIKTFFQTMALTAFAIIGITEFNSLKAEDPYSQCMDACQNAVNECKKKPKCYSPCKQRCNDTWHKCNDNCSPKRKK